MTDSKSEFRTYNVVNFAVKIACYQTVPGEEANVIDRILKKIENNDEIIKYEIIKSFGRYDLIFIYITNNFDYNFTKLGPIVGVIKTNTFLCHPICDDKVCKFIDLMDDTPFFGISFIKYDYADYHNKVCKLANRPDHEDFIFNEISIGTLGWHEIIDVTSSNNINFILDNLLNFASKKDGHKLSKKSITYFGINKKFMPNESLIKEAIEDDSTEKIIKHIKSIFKEIDIPIDEKKLTLLINVNSFYYDEAVCFWTNKNYSCYQLLGRDDIIVEIDPKNTFADFVGNLLVFRYLFKNKINSTSTLISNKCTCNIDSVVTHRRYDYDKYRKAFNFNLGFLESYSTENCIILSNLINLIIELSSNAVAGDAFDDLLYYHNRIVHIYNHSNFNNYNIIELITKSIYVYKKGLENRVHGVNNNIEELTHSASRISGGFHKSILAIESLPFLFIKKVDPAGWKGFVVVDDIGYYHLNDVIGVPESSLWNICNWWPIYHEIGHMLIDRSSNNKDDKLLDFESEELKTFLTLRRNPQYWKKEFIEYFAEIILFYIGFFDDIVLYMDLSVKRIYNLSELGDTVILKYILKCYFLKIYFFISNDIKSLEQLVDQNYHFNEIFQFVSDIERLIKRNIPQKYFFSGVNAKNFSQLYDVISSFDKNLKKYDQFYFNTYRWSIKSSIEDLESDLTNNIIECIKRGEIWHDRSVIFPYQAVLYRLFKSDKIEFKENIAAILSFAIYGEGIRQYRLKSQLQYA